jgi:hypothetical protein
MQRPAAEAIDQPAVDGAEAEFPALGPRPRALVVVEQPLELGPAKIGIEHQACPFAEQCLEPSLFELGTAGGGPPVLPHDRSLQRATGLAVPEHRGLTLVGDADRGAVGPVH